jgi:hypothetical protein
MSNLTPLPANSQLHYKPSDHSWVSVDDSIPFYAQASYPVNQFAIPPFDNIALTNNGDGNPLTAVYSKNSTTVATLTFTYDGSGYLTNAAITYPA